MKGFVVQARRRETVESEGVALLLPAGAAVANIEASKPFETVIFCHNRGDAEEWMKQKINHAEIESRILPAMAVPKDMVSSEFVIDTAH